MTLPVLIACDPGTVESAMVVLTPMPGARACVVRATMVDSTFAGMSAWLTEVEQRYGRALISGVAVEWAEGAIYQPFRGPPLLKAQGTAGEFSGLAQARGYVVTKVSQATWRKGVLGKIPRRKAVPGVKLKREPVEALVKRALPLFVDGVTDSNGHVHDAAGLGLFVSWTAWRRRAA